MNKRSCVTCGVALTGLQTRFCSIICKNKAHQCYPQQKARGLARKLDLVKARGGCCSVCGYRKNLAALTFHHTSNKRFQLDMRALSNRTLESVMAEVEKCILVCHNCHAEHHNPSLGLSLLLR